MTDLRVQIMQWKSEGRRKRGRPSRSWISGVYKQIKDRGLEDTDWNDRESW